MSQLASELPNDAVRVEPRVAEVRREDTTTGVRVVREVGARVRVLVGLATLAGEQHLVVLRPVAAAYRGAVERVLEIVLCLTVDAVAVVAVEVDAGRSGRRRSGSRS